MSAYDGHSGSTEGTGGSPLRKTEEATVGVNMRLILGVGVVSVGIFAVSAWVAYLTMKSRGDALRAEYGSPAETKTMVYKDEVGIVDNIPFDEDRRLTTWRAKVARKAESYGWADRKAGLVRIPVAEAMRRVVAENRHDAVDPQPLSWPTAPPAPGTLEAVMRNVKPAMTSGSVSTPELAQPRQRRTAP